VRVSAERKVAFLLGSLSWYPKAHGEIPKKTWQAAYHRSGVGDSSENATHIAALDAWAAKQDQRPSRPEAIRRLVALAIAGSYSAKRTSPKAAAKALEMAGQQIDKLANPAMPEEERRARKRRLIKGPREFREIRGDQPKAK
jgi:hypothetical protein